MNKKSLLLILSLMASLLIFSQPLYAAIQQPAKASSVSPDPEFQSSPAAIVKAANVFLKTLTEAQKKSVLFAFNDQAQRVRWSNFPVGFVPRAGLRWGKLNDEQQRALIGLLGTVLSPQGLLMVQEQMEADDIVKRTSSGGPPNRKPPANADGANHTPPPGALGPPGGSPPPVHFGSDFYYVSFLGMPSGTKPWMLQFGGHHLAINATMVGPNLTLSPSLTGGQPLKYSKNGQAVYIVGQEVKQAAVTINSLTPAHRAKAIISSHYIDLVLGPGHDGETLQPEGVSGAELTDTEKDELLALIEARLNILNANAYASALGDIKQHLDETYFAWYGPTDKTGAAYFRVTGPTVIIEYAPQDLDGDPTDHAHSMYRNPTNEYGAAWTSLK